MVIDEAHFDSMIFLNALFSEYAKKKGLENLPYTHHLPYSKWDDLRQGKIKPEDYADILHKANNYWREGTYGVERDLIEMLETLYGRKYDYNLKSEKAYVTYQKKPPKWVRELIKMSKIDEQYEEVSPSEFQKIFGW